MAVQNTLTQHAGVSQCFGIAPKGDLERRIDATLKQLKVLKN